MIDKDLKAATNEYIWAERQLRRLKELLEPRPKMTMKQKIDACNSIERILKTREKCLKTMMDVIDNVCPEDRNEWADLMAPYFEPEDK